ncbi:MAG: 2-oxoacid:acceptor oxidoreductase subunit alpha [Bacteroidetes bacterium]|nr:2-oxoacid:acceptor oxidoreductase subunit alpha [Rhodothermia bacterium]MCS7155386.1 2-oxoacid:acceptor oxidoreductase subunit alpha [Bacteroidota bacterium]MCX7907521.1 2-oxoacid:acceptor oxidoreductase subunit alpha [Bacteroidota bacterium]MDW8138515.1 2-oxoacid:acceptor oxidoreductase subunit alpha [Bacteroidota bacterium]MDW8284548.1 2-oxoacid:acceptor oxidoreductase subunit alpha [Bacteroidota bacterium]
MSKRDIRIVELPEVTVRIAGDSGDGMQLTGSQFTSTTALVGNDLSTLPDFPAEIRAPAGTTYGVSAFQIRFASSDILTPGDESDALVAMNPAALKTNLARLRKGGILIVNEDAFSERDLQLAGYRSNPLEDGSLAEYELYRVPVTRLTEEALKELNLPFKIVERSKNMFALGLLLWLYDRPMDHTVRWLEQRFAKQPDVLEANLRALRAGYHYGDTVEAFTTRFRIGPAKLPPGTYRNITGNQATALGLVAASYRAGLELFYGSYPITPASDILHELARYKNFRIFTFQAEDEIAAVTAVIGAAYGGKLAVTGTSGPGLALKTEAIGLGVMLELPFVVLDIQRAGPSTGMPTKTEQADLLQAMFGRNGEAPVPIVAPATPGECFWMVLEACRIALTYMTPVLYLSDGYLANGSEPWRIPEPEELPDLRPRFAQEPNRDGRFLPYVRDPKTLARPWALPGTPGLMHRIGGLEKQHETGNVSYDPDNHDFMVRLRAEKIERIAESIPPAELEGDPDASLLVLGWGSTYGAIKTAVERLRQRGYKLAQVHLRYLNPFPQNLGEILQRFGRIIVPEINLGQLVRLIRDRYLVPAEGYNRVRGLPFTASELEAKLLEALTQGNGSPGGRNIHG